MHVRKQTFLNFIPVVSWYSKPYFIIVNLFGEKYIVSYYCVSKFAPSKKKIFVSGKSPGAQSMHVRKQTFLNFIPVVSWYSKPYFLIVNLFGGKYIVSYYCVSKFAPSK